MLGSSDRKRLEPWPEGEKKPRWRPAQQLKLEVEFLLEMWGLGRKGVEGGKTTHSLSLSSCQTPGGDFLWLNSLREQGIQVC